MRSEKYFSRRCSTSPLRTFFGFGCFFAICCRLQSFVTGLLRISYVVPHSRNRRTVIIDDEVAAFGQSPEPMPKLASRSVGQCDPVHSV